MIFEFSFSGGGSWRLVTNVVFKECVFYDIAMAMSKFYFNCSLCVKLS